MPDISLLQNDIDLEARESRIPGVFLTISILLLIISILSYVWFYFLNETSQSELVSVENSIKSLGNDNAENDVGKLNSIESQLNVLQTLRKKHTNTNAALSVIAGSVEDNVFYKAGGINVSSQSAELSGTAASPKDLARQVSIYAADPKIASYKISGVTLDSVGTVSFKASLSIKN